MRRAGMKIVFCSTTIVFFIIRGMKNSTVTLKWAIFYMVFPAGSISLLPLQV
jgi:hypothetical protein